MEDPGPDRRNVRPGDPSGHGNAPETSGRWLARLVADPTPGGVSGGYDEAGRRDPVLSSALSQWENMAADLRTDSGTLVSRLLDQTRTAEGDPVV